MTISVVIPTFNPGEKLVRSLNSVRALNGRAGEVEIVVQDGASTDQTQEVLAAQNDLSWQSAPDGGVFDAMNRGLARAGGDWLLFLGAGDLLRPDLLREGALREVLLKKRGAMALVYGDAWLCEENFRYGGPFSPAKLRNWTPSHQAILYNRRVFEKLGGYELRFKIAADYAFNLSCWGDPEIERIYVETLICDYEGCGLSKMVRDEKFESEKMRLIRQRLGVRTFWLRKIELATPAPLKRARVAFLQTWARFR